MGGSGKWCKEYWKHEQDGGTRKTFKEDKNYSQQNISLINTLPNISTQPSPKSHPNDPNVDSGCTGHYLDAI